MKRVTMKATWGTKRDWRWLWLRKRPVQYDLGRFDVKPWTEENEAEFFRSQDPE